MTSTFSYTNTCKHSYSYAAASLWYQRVMTLLLVLLVTTPRRDRRESLPEGFFDDPKLDAKVK